MDEENEDGKSRSKISKINDAVQKLNEEEHVVDSEVSIHETKSLPKVNATTSKPLKSIVERKYTKEYIPQREKDRECALERKLHAIEIYRKSKKGLDKTRKVKSAARKIKKEAELSESDSN